MHLTEQTSKWYSPPPNLALASKGLKINTPTSDPKAYMGEDVMGSPGYLMEHMITVSTGFTQATNE